VLNARFGLDVTIRGVVGADSGAGPGTGPGRPAGSASPGPVAASDPVDAAPARSRSRHDEPPDDLSSDEFVPDDISPDEPDGDQAPVVTELTGMDLIQRELGGQVIGEIDD
jgi:DNA polymerase III subunit gamma/tau